MSRHRVKKTAKSLESTPSTPSTPVRAIADMLVMDEEGSLMQKGFHLEQDGEGDVESSDNYRRYSTIGCSCYFHLNQCCRFSSRMRRKTDFYVSLLADENGDDDSNNSGSSSGGRRRKIPSVARKLSFENYTYQSPLVAPRPDILVGDNSDCCLEVRSGENQGIKEDTLTKVSKINISMYRLYIMHSISQSRSYVIVCGCCVPAVPGYDWLREAVCQPQPTSHHHQGQW